MRSKKVIKKYFNRFLLNSWIMVLLSLFILSLSLLPNKAIALSEDQGSRLFIENCAGCHINGGNIIRRSKTLKLKDLKRNGLDSAEAIAKVAKEGIGIMSGYKEILGENGDELVANWIWNQAQNAWVQG